MKQVEICAGGRRAVLIERISERAAAEQFGINARTVSKMLRFSVPPGYVRTKPPFWPKLEAFIGIIDAILAVDKERPKKQRHTSKRIFERQRTREFSELQSHYLFNDRFGRPAKRKDKGKVEGLVGYARRNLMVPIPVLPDFEALNAHLVENCRKRLSDRLRGHDGERLAHNLTAFQKLLPAATTLRRRDRAASTRYCWFATGTTTTRCRRRTVTRRF